MATATINDTRDVPGDQCVEFHDIGWKGYSALLRIRGERRVPRMVYLDGTVWLMSPQFRHENLSERLGWLIQVIVEEFDIPCILSGSTTFRRRVKRAGVEGDKTFYLANAHRVRGKKKLFLKIDPPPDLAIEAVDTHDAGAAVEVYRRFQVPEVWVCDAAELAIRVLQPNGRYAQSATSLAFPFLAATEVFEWVHRPQSESDTAWVKELRVWVKQTLKSRVESANS